MARDFQQIAAAAAYINNAQTADETTSLPPGYISGFYVTLKQDYTVTISAGTAYVAGRAVKMTEEHLLAGSDWVVPRLDTPQHYYIYLDKSGAIHVDLVQPKFNSGYGYYEQPDYGWRAIGKIFVKSNDIIFASWNEDKKSSTVTIAPAGYTGEADYYCTGTADDILINAAILYVYTAYYGGTVQLLAGTYDITSKINQTYNGIEINGDGYATNLIRNSNSLVIDASGTVGTSLYGGGISNLRVTGYDTNTVGYIQANYRNKFSISKVYMDNLYYTGIEVYGTGVKVSDNTITALRANKGIKASGAVVVDNNYIGNSSVSYANDITGISCQSSSNMIISNNIIEGIASSSGTLIGIEINNADYVDISNNVIKDFSSTDAAPGRCYGILVDNGTYVRLNANRITNCDQTDTTSWGRGIFVSGGNNNACSNNTIRDCSGYGIYVGAITSLQVGSNYCFNNGADVGIANTNSNNFYDAGTDTQTYSNSWQSPVTAEPSLGTPHYHPSQWAAELYSNATPAANTFYTVTAAGLPQGTTKIQITGYITGSTAGDELHWRPYGSADTYLQSKHRSLGIVPSANGYSFVCGPVTVDSSGRFEVAVGNAATDIYIHGYSFYWC